MAPLTHNARTCLAAIAAGGDIAGRIEAAGFEPSLACAVLVEDGLIDAHTFALTDAGLAAAAADLSAHLPLYRLAAPRLVRMKAEAETADAALAALGVRFEDAPLDAEAAQ